MFNFLNMQVKPFVYLVGLIASTGGLINGYGPSASVSLPASGSLLVFCLVRSFAYDTTRRKVMSLPCFLCRFCLLVSALISPNMRVILHFF
jgi:hypothetical protein